jgi:aminoglycoside 6'-N-acetyltransferase I
VGEVLVRLLGPDDLALLAAPADDVFDAAIIPSVAAETLGDPRHHIVGAIADGRLIGFASAVHYVHPDKPAQLFVNEVGVSESWQRQGIGRRLVDVLLAHGHRLGCTEAWVLTDDDNDAARALYSASGGDEAPTRIFVFQLGG